MTVTEYIGARYVPIFGRMGETSVQWDNSAPYEPLTIVFYQGNSYTSRQYVPAGIDITNTQYWAITGNFNAQVEQYRQEVQGFDARIDANEEKIEEEKENVINQLSHGFPTFTEVGSIPRYQYKTPTGTNNTRMTLQGFCVSDDHIFGINRADNDSLSLTKCNILNNTYNHISLSFTGHANTVNVGKNNNLVVSSNANGKIYVINENGAVINTYDDQTNDGAVFLNPDAQKYMAFSYNDNKLYTLNDDFTIAGSIDILIGFTANCNVCFDNGKMYLANTLGIVVAIDVESGKIVDSFRIAANKYKEFEGLSIHDGKAYAGFAYYNEDATTFETVNIGQYESTIWNNNLTKTFFNINADYNATSLLCDGSNQNPYCAMSIALSVFNDCGSNNIYCRNFDSVDFPIFIVNQYAAFIFENCSFDTTLDFYGNGRISLRNLSTTSSVQLHDMMEIEFRNCTVDTINANQATEVVLINTTVSNLLSCSNADVAIYGSTTVNGTWGTFDVNKVELFNTVNDTACIDTKRYIVFSADIVTDVNGNVFTVPAIGIRTGNKIVFLGNSYASLITDFVSAIVECRIDTTGKTISVSNNKVDNGTFSSIANIYGIG